MKKIGMLTGGGDAPGLNAVIRAVVKTAELEHNVEVVGIRSGFDGFFDDEGIMALSRDSIRGLLPRGGTILGAASRGNPFARKTMVDGEEVIEDVSEECVRRIEELELEALIVVGGDGTLKIARELHDKGVPAIGVPKTIDNDVGGTDATFGFDTALNIGMEALDRLHTTAESHHRVMILELMGRDAGFIALQAGIAGGADVILIPEIPFEFEAVCRKITSRVETGRLFSIMAVSEGAHVLGGQQVYRRAEDGLHVARLGGIGQVVGKFVESVCGAETRVTVLGHIQRGGTPTAFDRWLATHFGAAAIDLAVEGKFGEMVALRGTDIIHMPLAEALRENRKVDVNGGEVSRARGLGIAFGDESEKPKYK
ncbi:MAG: ATP-dependent 6-phosphofructokinase [Anaerolineae bacterium]|nr:ATP-dependent 6-phosphofructokinase [Anaerolineae bacterium]